MKKNNEPLNILAPLVIGSANDVLAGLITWEEHLEYLQSESNRLKLNFKFQEERNMHDVRPNIPKKRHDRVEVSKRREKTNYPIWDL